MATELHVTEPLTGLVRRRNQRAPWRRDTWTPEEVALALHARRAALRRELGRLPAARGVASFTLDEIVDDAACVVVMKLRQIRDEEHLRRAFWLSVNLLLARHHEGRGHLRVGSRERADFESVKQTAASEEPTVAQVIELKERLARAADYVAQLNDLEGRVTAHMAIRGVGIKLAARELGLPLNTVKAAAHSAETKLEQVAAIAAAGGMCAYREPAILAHASRVARPEQVRVAQAHISACSRCQRSYVQLVREMRRREFQRQATAAFLPPPMLVAAHTGVLPRVVAFLSTHAPGNVSPGNFGVRERALGLIGSGAGAAKAAGLLAGATLIVVGASTVPSGAPRSYRLHHRATSVRHTERRVAALARGEAAAPEARAVPSETSPARSTRPTLRTGGFSYLGGNAATRSQHSSAIAASPGKAASLNYLGGNRRAPAATARTASAAAPSSSSTSTASKGGQFSP